MKGAVEGSVVKVENIGGETSWVSWAYGPTAKMERGPPGEYMLAEIEVRETKPAGECAADGGSEGRKDAGEEGGAANGTVMGGGWPKLRTGGG